MFGRIRGKLNQGFLPIWFLLIKTKTRAKKPALNCATGV
jgi:hypothetical protein